MQANDLSTVGWEFLARRSLLTEHNESRDRGYSQAGRNTDSLLLT